VDALIAGGEEALSRAPAVQQFLGTASVAALTP
jgi:hypothetical protein